jgi:hypothetical protein
MSEEAVGMIKIMASSSEKIGLPNYSSVDVGPISVTRFIEDCDDETLKKEITHNLYLIEEIISDVREVVLDSVQESKK